MNEITENIPAIFALIIILIFIVVFIEVTLWPNTTLLSAEGLQAQSDLSLDAISYEYSVSSLRNLCNATRELNLSRPQCDLWAALVFYFEQQKIREN